MHDEDAAGRADAFRGGDAGASVKSDGGPAVKREAIAHLQNLMDMSERRAYYIVRTEKWFATDHADRLILACENALERCQ